MPTPHQPFPLWRGAVRFQVQPAPNPSQPAHRLPTIPAGCEVSYIALATVLNVAEFSPSISFSNMFP
jgi:hypothetical protein